MKKTVFLDRDGTINIDKGYVYKIRDFEFLPGVVEGLRMLQNLRYQLVIVTNQSGIARGYYTEKDYVKLNDWMLDKLTNEGIIIKKTYFCPHLKEGVIKEYAIECECRKPKPGLFYKAITELDIAPEGSFAIGDKMRDLCICKYTGIQGILLSSDSNETSDIMAPSLIGEQKIIVRKDLFEAAQYIANNT